MNISRITTKSMVFHRNGSLNVAIRWPGVDEDLRIEGILHGIPSVKYRKPLRQGAKNPQPEMRA